MSNWIKESFSFHDLQRIMFKLLERVELFAGLTQKELLDILESAEKCTFNEGETIVREGSTGAFLYIIIEGRVSVIKQPPAVREAKELAQLQGGDCFGEMSLVDQQARSATVVALKRCLLLRLSENECWRHPSSSAKIFRNLARVLSQRLRQVDEALSRVK